MRGSVLFAIGAMVLSRAVATAGTDEQQLIKYYRKKANVPPAAKVMVTGLHESTFKGAKEGVLEVGEGATAQRVPFATSEDGRYVLFASVEDLTVDPAKVLMQRISLKGEPAKGPANAKVTIVEYSDFQCPFCSRGYQTIETQVLKEYGDKVRFYYKNYPLSFHPWAQTGAVAAECAKEQKPEAFWRVYSGLFENQAQISTDNVKEKVAGFLADAHIDMAKWNDCFDNQKSLPVVKAQVQEGSAVGVHSTPSFVINGRLVSGAQPFETFKNIIDDELATPN